MTWSQGYMRDLAKALRQEAGDMFSNRGGGMPSFNAATPQNLPQMDPSGQQAMFDRIREQKASGVNQPMPEVQNSTGRVPEDWSTLPENEITNRLTTLPNWGEGGSNFDFGDFAKPAIPQVRPPAPSAQPINPIQAEVAQNYQPQGIFNSSAGKW